MKISLFLFALFATLCVSSASLLDALNAAHNSPAFKQLSHHDQLLVIELISETEHGELKQYIDSIGLHTVLAVIDKLPEAEAHILTQYMMKELAIEESQGTTMSPAAVGKRSLTDVLNAAKNDPAFKHLTQADQALIIKMLRAAESNQLTALVNQTGYSTVLRLVDILPTAERHLFEQYLIQHLQDESSIIG